MPPKPFGACIGADWIICADMKIKFHRLFLLSFLLLTSCGDGGGGLNVNEKTVVNATPADTWKIIGKFNDLGLWHPAVARTEMSDDGYVRVLHLIGGGEIHERLIEYIDGDSYTYEIVKGPLPVKNYVSTLSVEPTQDGRTRIIWEGNFDPADGIANSVAEEEIRKVYRAGLDRLR